MTAGDPSRRAQDRLARLKGNTARSRPSGGAILGGYMKFYLSACLLALTILGADAAQAQSFLVEANGAHTADRDGVELGLGYSIANTRFRLTPRRRPDLQG